MYNKLCLRMKLLNGTTRKIKIKMEVAKIRGCRFGRCQFQKSFSLNEMHGLQYQDSSIYEIFFFFYLNWLLLLSCLSANFVVI